MTKYVVLTTPEKKLRERSVEIQADEILSGDTKQLILDLKETMKAQNGVGIAASQIGVLKRVIIVETGTGSKAFINPTITKRSLRKKQSEEGCLSVPGVFGIVLRHRTVTVEAIDENGETVTIHADQLLAIIFQHEIDHLDGILFIDKVFRFTSQSSRL